MNYPALNIKGLNTRYRGKRVLEEINLELPRQKLAAIIGPNGAGKTTLINAILGLTECESGDVRFFSGTLEEKRQTIAYMPQRSNVDWDFPITVKEVVLMGRLPHLKWWQRPTKLDKKIAMEALEKVTLVEYANAHISELSGGQQQRMFLARAIAQRASLYLLDEPFAAIDMASEKAIIDQLRIIQSEGATLLCVHHNLNSTPEYFDYVFLLNRRIIAQGPLKETFTMENIRQTYSNSLPLLSEIQEKI